MADNNVKIIVTAVDNASKNVKKVESSFSKLNKGFEQLTGLSIPTAGGLALIGTGLAKVQQFVSSSIKDWQAYVQQIKEMSLATGTGAEEMSRLLQTADDMGVEAADLQAALTIMNKNGVQPSIASLADLADEYVNTANKQEYAQRLTKLFGRNYAAMIPMLSKGGQFIRDNAAAIADNMVVTEDSIRQSEEYRVALDNLNDAFQGLKNEVGKEALPFLTDRVNGFMKAMEGFETAGGIIAKIVAYLKWAYQSGGVPSDYNQSWESFNQYLQDTEVQASNTADALETELAPAQEEANTKVQNATRLLGGPYQEALQRARERMTDFKNAAEDDAAALDALNRTMQQYDDYINGQLGPNQEEFTKTQADLEQQMKDVQAEIDLALYQGYWPMGEKITELKGRYAELQTQYGENADEHEDATKRIILDIMAQQMAAQGLTDPVAYAKIARNWGLIDQATVDATINTAKAVNWLKDHPGDIAGFEARMNGIITDVLEPAQAVTNAMAVDLAAINGTYNLRINVDVTGDEIPKLPQDSTVRPGEGYGQYQHGADFVIPPGFNENFPIGYGSSGERVMVIPKGGNTITNNFNYRTNAPNSNIMRDFRISKAMAG